LTSTRAGLTGAAAQVPDVDLLLLHARRLADQTRVVVRVAVGGAHRVLIVAAAVDVTDAPEEEEAGREEEEQGGEEEEKEGGGEEEEAGDEEEEGGRC